MSVYSVLSRGVRPVFRTANSLRQVRSLVRSAWSEIDTVAPARSLVHELEVAMVFYAQYESLVEVLCDAANYGPDAHAESRFAQIRTWMQSHYPEIRPHVVAFLPEGADFRSIENRESTMDAFESLFQPSTVDELLRTDDGQMIQRIIVTREAIDRYAADLRAKSA